MPAAATPPATIGVGSSNSAPDNGAGAPTTGEDPLAVGGVTNGNPGASAGNAPNAGNALPQTPDALAAATAGSTADAAAARLAGTVAAAGRATDTSSNGVHGSAGQASTAGLNQSSQSDPQFVVPQAAGADTSSDSLGLSNSALITSTPGSDDNNSDAIGNQAGTAPDASVNVNSLVAAPIATATTAAAPTHAADTTNALVPISEVAVTIAARAQSGSSNFEIRLDPPDLGRIDVQLKVDSGGNVTSHIIAERPETLGLLQRQAPQLERALQDAGLNTGEGMQFSLADQGFAGKNAYTAPDFDSGTSTAIPTSDSVPAMAAQGYASWSGRSGGLDITV